MSSFPRKIKLIDVLKTELEIQRPDFIKSFHENVDDDNLGFMSGKFDFFSFGNKEYRGKINQESFEIRRRRKFFEHYTSLVRARGNFFQRDDTLVIETEIRALHKGTIPFFVFIVFFYLVFLFSILLAENMQSLAILMIVVAFFGHGLFVFTILYFALRRSVGKLKYDLEREFYFMTKDVKAPRT